MRKNFESTVCQLLLPSPVPSRYDAIRACIKAPMKIGFTG